MLIMSVDSSYDIIVITIPYEIEKKFFQNPQQSVSDFSACLLHYSAISILEIYPSEVKSA